MVQMAVSESQRESDSDSTESKGNYIGDSPYKGLNQEVKGQRSLKQDRKRINLIYNSAKSQTQLQKERIDPYRETPRG